MNNQDQIPEEEIVNPEQFQVGRNPDNERQEDQHNEDTPQDAGYTPGETAFADGEGSRLDQESNTQEEEYRQETDTDDGGDDENPDYDMA